MNRRGAARWAGPVAFLVAVTIAALLARAGLRQGNSSGGPPPATTTQTRPHHTRKHRGRKTTTTTTTTTTAGGSYYTVQSGDTFSSIAASLGTTSAALEQLNPGVDPSALHVGQKIRVK